MSTLAEYLIEKIHPDVSPLWAVADGDSLFRNDAVDRLLGECGAEVLLYEDPMAFRYRYEHQIRPRLESGDPGCHIIVLDPDLDGFHNLPADIYETCRRIEVTLGDLFPSLSRNVLVGLEPAMLGKLWEKRDQFPTTPLGDRDTADLVLRLGYRIEITFIGNFQDLVHILIDLHFTGRRLPNILAKRLEEAVGKEEIQSGDLQRLVRNPAAFWQYLQNEWELWVAPDNTVGPDKTGSLREFVFPAVSFTEDRVRVWVDNLFLEGLLEPVPADRVTNPLPQPWCRVGVAATPSRPDSTELTKQREHLVSELPGEDADYKDWLRFAQGYSSHVAAAFAADQSAGDTEAFWNELWSPLDERFHSFACSRLESLGSLPPTRPVLAHHIPQFLARRVKANKKIALLVLDGLSLAQWKVVRRELEHAMMDLLISDDACFTLVPSVTNVCRQAIYAGELPVFFESTIGRTDVDEKRWKAFWDSSCGRPVKCAHHNVEGRDTDLDVLLASLEGGNRAVGITIRMPDEIVHGATMGWRGIMAQLKLWTQSSFLTTLIQATVDSGFELFLTSDHGNIEAIGDGSVSQGVLADRKGERVRVYGDETILNHTASGLGDRAFRWEGKFLPGRCLPLIHRGRGAFVQKGQPLVCHGGASLDELVIPFIEISRTAKS
jgi:hypothetical protein